MLRDQTVHKKNIPSSRFSDILHQKNTSHSDKLNIFSSYQLFI